MTRQLSALAMAGTLAVGALLSGAAQAGTFDIKGTDVEKGSSEVSNNNTFFSGYPVNSELLRSSHELAFSRGLTDRWQAGIKMNGDNVIGDGFVLSTVGTEHTVMFRKFENGFGFAMFGGLDIAVDRDATNAFTVGPLFKFGTEKTSIGLNTLFTKTFGQNREEGVDFSYAWNVKQEVREGFAVGIEGHGLIPNIANAPGKDFQEHRIGPVLYFERQLTREAKRSSMKLGGKMPAGVMAPAEAAPEGPTLSVEVGILFGLTEGTQDRAFKFKGAISF